MVGVGMPAVSNFVVYEDRCRLKPIIAIFIGAGLGSFAALVARPNAQQLLPEHPARHARGESHRRLYHRAGRCILPIQRPRAGMAVIRHYWLLWWSDHILDLLVGDRNVVAAEAITGRLQRSRIAPRGLCVNDLCRNRNSSVGKKLRDSQQQN
jgi:hypothetical protein